MLSMHRIESQVHDISLSINELNQHLFKDDPKSQAIGIRNLNNLDHDIDDLDEMLFQFGDKSNQPLDYLTTYDLNACQIYLRELVDLLKEDADNQEQIQQKLESLKHTWKDNYLTNFMIWFKELLGQNLMIIKDGLAFDDGESASIFLEMIKRTLQAEALIFSQEYGDNRMSIALSRNRMVYGERFHTKAIPCSMRIATESGAVVALPSEPHKNEQEIMQTLGWKIASPKQWQNPTVQKYLNYISRPKLTSAAEQISFASSHPLQFSNVYTAPTHSVHHAATEIPELPLGIALACAQRLIAGGHIADSDVFTENGCYGVLNDSNLVESNLPITVAKLESLFACFLETYTNDYKPSPVESSAPSYRTPSLTYH